MVSKRAAGDIVSAVLIRDTHVPGGTTRVVDLPPGMGQMILPDGSIVPASRAVVVPRNGRIYKDAYPVPDDYTR